jgi:hypothetical protein
MQGMAEASTRSTMPFFHGQIRCAPGERLSEKNNCSNIEAAKAMLANPDIGVTQIAHRLGVSPATLYRYIPAARSTNLPIL